MRASGNGDVQICVHNLLRTVRGEVPYDRIKGIDRTLIDQPCSIAAQELAADIEFLIATYEPRVDLVDTDVGDLGAKIIQLMQQHDFNTNPDIEHEDITAILGKAILNLAMLA